MKIIDFDTFVFCTTESKSILYFRAFPRSLLLATTKVTDMAYLSFRERPVEFIKKEPDDKPGYVMNDHLSNSAVASSL